MSNILLISGAVSGDKRYGKLEKVGAYLPPYGLLSVAASLEKAGHTVTLIDREVSPVSGQEILAYIQRHKPDLVGLSIFTIGSEESMALAQAVKEKFGSIPIIAGGPHVFVGADYLKEYSCFDYLVVGEGEATAVELVSALEKGRQAEEIPGLIIRQADGWQDTGVRPQIANLDQLPFPAFHLLENIKLYHPSPFGYRKLPHLPLVTSRGCPFQCIFCSRIWGNKWRAHSAEYVLDMIKYVVTRFGIKEIWFAEDTFAINRERVIQICEGILAANLDIAWSCMTNINVLDKELLTLMKRSGCWQVQLGLESGNDQVLKFIRKPITTAMIREKVNLIHSLGIKIRGYFILGHLIDTRETIQQTIDFACSLPLYTAEFHILHLPLGSKARLIAHDYGTVNEDLSLLTGYTHSGLSFVPQGLTEKEMFEFRRQGHNRFFLRPTMILRHLSEIKSWRDVKRYALVTQAFLKNIK
jgi:anaerobic magnesium-protoporphyrin IX monomethyl ester cyclase